MVKERVVLTILMNTKQPYLQALIKQKALIGLVIAIVVGLTMAWTISQPLRYSSTIKVLLVPAYNPQVDSFVATQSVERIGKSLTSVVETTSFYDYVVTYDPSMQAIFPKNADERRKAWEETVEARVLPDSGMISITGYHEDIATAEAVALSVATVLSNSGHDFHGAGNAITITQVDAPLNSPFPVKPHIPKNIVLSVFVGVLLGVVLAFYKEREKLEVTAVAQPVLAPAEQPEVAEVVETLKPVITQEVHSREILSDDTEKIDIQEVEVRESFSIPPATKMFTMHDHLRMIRQQ